MVRGLRAAAEMIATPTLVNYSEEGISWLVLDRWEVLEVHTEVSRGD